MALPPQAGVDVKPQPLLAAALCHSRQRIDHSCRRRPGGTDNHEREEAMVSILGHTSLQFAEIHLQITVSGYDSQRSPQPRRGAILL